ncbi:hypothetical protein JCM3774_005098 [Rhodotorula dairenensis]
MTGPTPAHASQRKTAAGARRPSALAQLVKWLLLALVTNVALSRALTQSWTWGYDGKWIKPRTYRELVRPTAPVVLSETQLALHDGTRPDRYPLYLAFDGDVYDISDGGMRNYGPGGAYHQFAGKDAARAFVTGCFKTHLTHDLRGLTQDQLAIVTNWKNFYRNHAKYRHIGKVVHPPIDPASPIPPPFKVEADSCLRSLQPSTLSLGPSSAREPRSSPPSESSFTRSPTVASLVQEAAVAAVLCTLVLLPAYFLLPSYVRPLFGSVTALVTSILYVTAFALVLAGALVVALVAEKAYRRWWLGQVPSGPARDPLASRVGDASAGEGPDALRRARRFTREARMDAVAERVIESFEQTSIGRHLVRRRNKRNAAARTAPAGTHKSHKSPAQGVIGGESYELHDLASAGGGTARTTARRRTPPPLPAR